MLSSLPPSLKIVELNVENLFLPKEHLQEEDVHRLSEKEWNKLQGGIYPLKSLEKTLHLAQHILRIDPHILILSEVGGKQTLEIFNNLFLHGQYQVLLLEGNSSRGIDLGFMVKKDLPFRYSLQSHRHRPIFVSLPDGQIERRKFSRDVLELRIFNPDLLEKRPLLVLLAVHLKSKLRGDPLDPQGRLLRTAEVNGIIEIYQKLSHKFKKKTGVIVAGDFNGSAGPPYPDPEFSAIYEKTDLQDALERAGKSQDEKITYFHFHPSDLIEKNQLDYLFLNPLLQEAIVTDETYVYSYTDPPVHPQTRDERRTWPSDHLPVVLTLRMPLIMRS